MLLSTSHYHNDFYKMLLFFCVFSFPLLLLSFLFILSKCNLVQARENKGTERDNEGVGWDMSILLKLFLTLDGNGRLFPQTSA